MPSFEGRLSPTAMNLPEAQRSFVSRRPYLVGGLFGVAGSVVLLVSIFVACGPLSHSSCGASNVEPVVWIASTMLCLVAIFAITFPGGLRLALAFGITLLVLSAGTHGLLLKLWATPVYAIADAARPVWAPIALHQQLSTRKREWIATTSAQTLDPIHGVRMARLLEDCIEKYRDANPLASYPHNAAVISSEGYCTSLARDRIDADVADSSRYTLNEDHGYRWSYAPAGAGGDGRIQRYSIRVEPDSLIRKPGPLYRSDENGLLVERARAEAPGTAVGSPVPILKDMLPCIAQLDLERRRRRSRQNYYYSEPTAFDAAMSACPDLAGRFRRNESAGGVTLSVPIHEQRGAFLDTAAVYLLTYTPLDVEGVNFELRAAPLTASGGRIRSGVRRYLVTADGAVHVTREARDATASDPAPDACETDPLAHCVH